MQGSLAAGPAVPPGSVSPCGRATSGGVLTGLAQLGNCNFQTAGNNTSIGERADCTPELRLYVVYGAGQQDPASNFGPAYDASRLER